MDITNNIISFEKKQEDEYDDTNGFSNSSGFNSTEGKKEMNYTILRGMVAPHLVHFSFVRPFTWAENPYRSIRRLLQEGQ